MVVRIVVARYMEPIAWTQELEHVTIYNKGSSPDQDAAKHCVVQLPNVGREQHTYFRHICDNYDNLDDHTVFVQGHPFDHSPDLLERLRAHAVDEWKGVEFHCLCRTTLKCKLKGGSEHKGLPLQAAHTAIFGSEWAGEFRFGAGSQFVVSRERVLRRPKEFYQRILDMLENESLPRLPWVFERFTRLIFADQAQIYRFPTEKKKKTMAAPSKKQKKNRRGHGRGGRRR